MRWLLKNYDNDGEHQNFQRILIALMFFLILHSVLFLNGYFSFVTLLYGLILQLSIDSTNKDLKLLTIKNILLCLPFICFSMGLYFYPETLTMYFIFIINGVFLIGYSFLVNRKLYSGKKDIHSNWVLFNKYFLIISGLVLIISGFEIESDYYFDFGPRIIAACLLFVELIYVWVILIILNTPKLITENQPDIKILKFPTHKSSFLHKIEDYFLSCNDYLDPSYNFEKFSKDMKMNKQQLSHFLNNELQLNFYQLLAFYRIKFAKKRIRESAHIYTIESLILECGYHSKSTFNKHFKNIVGKTPSEYRNFHLKNNGSD
ncbi:helix-turn-helix domain-containing protein [Myroides ceti]|uniref:Helix-turn-helix domain-containing protein n=1 Tax=Paenimyroides ceti TaxID=395087 RepID=A0ABT8CYM6_9FLAO|nr:helix-turn-helix domain-containing protein [Paenimyroides ceti]MDN3708759.1 helix-turn-helix domain-containing protein [Paenimyroides ceti]MDN3709334.1 helix-turn-helix domain-containing protein [Paenimyroides ceti]